MIRKLTLITLLSATASATPAKLDALIGELAKLSCPTVSQLEKTFGRLHYDPSKRDPFKGLDLPVTTPGVLAAHASFVFDIYHHDPKKDLDPEGSVTVTLDGTTKPDAIGAMLAGATRYTAGTSTVWHAGSVYASGTMLEVTCGATPDWAQAAWATTDVDATVKTLIRTLDKKPAGALGDERFEINAETGHVSANFKTPLPASALLNVLGATQVANVATDVHLSNWHLVRYDGTAITYGKWKLEIRIEGQRRPESAQELPPLDIAKLRITSLDANLQ